jgi:hypothetical protein
MHLQVCRQQKGYQRVCCRRGKEEYTQRSRRGGVVVLFHKIKIRSGDWAIVFAGSVVGRKRGIALREFGIWAVTLKGNQNVAVLIQGVGGILVLVDTHLEKPLGGSKEFDIKAIVHGIFKLLFDGIVATNIEHILDKKLEAEPLVVFVVLDKIGQFGRRLDETF